MSRSKALGRPCVRSSCSCRPIRCSTPAPRIAQPLSLVALVGVGVGAAEGVIAGLVALNTHVSSSRPPPRWAPADDRAPARRTLSCPRPIHAGDELPGGNHRRGRADATPGGGHMARTDARPTAAAGGDRATRATSGPRFVATFRFGKVQPSSPSACRAAASRSVRHSA